MRLRRTFTIRNLVILSAILAVLVAGVRLLGRKDKGSEVRTATVVRGNVTSGLVVSGKVAAEKAATLNFPGPGKVSFVNVRTGDTVVRGQALLGLDTGDLKAAEQAAYYRYLAADAAAKKVEDDLKGKETTETFAEKNTRVAAQTARDIAYDSWLTAQRAVRNAVLRSPFAGVVTNLTTNSVGDTAGITDGVTIVDPGTLYFESEVDESDLGMIDYGQEVEIELDAYPGQRISGSVSNIGYETRISSTGATVVPVKIAFAGDQGGRLRLGLNGDATIVLGRVENTLVLPVEAVNDGRVRLPGKAAEEIGVETGLEGETEIEIKSGLNEGDVVVVY